MLWRLRATEAGCCLDQARANAVRKFTRRCFGERHDEHLRRQEGGQPRIAMAQHQPHIQGRNGERLSGAGTGLDEARAA